MRKTALFAFVLLGSIWGATFIFAKMAGELIAPGQIVILRLIAGFIPVFLYALWRGEVRWQHLRYTHHFIVMAVLATVIYYYTFKRGIYLLPSSIAGMLSGAIPLFAFLCAFVFLRAERITKSKALGVLLGFLGVLLIARPWTATGDINLSGVAWMLLGSLSVGSSFVYARKFISPLRLPAASLTAYQLGLACLISIAVFDMNGMGNIFTDTGTWVGLIFGLGLIGTGGAFILYYYIVENLGAVVASSVSYLSPVVAMLIGVLMVGEHIDPLGYVALLLIFAGVALLQFGDRFVKRRIEQPV